MQGEKKKMIVLLILGLVAHQHPVMSLLDLVTTAWSAYEIYSSVEDSYLKYTTPSTADLMDKTVELAETLDTIEETLESMQGLIGNLLSRIPLLGQINSDVQLLNSHVGRIDALYEELLYYVEHPVYFEGNSHEGLLNTFTSYNHGDVPASLTAIHSLIAPRKLGKFKKSLFTLLAEEVQDTDLEICGISSSLHQRIIDLYDVIIDTEMKASVMMGFAFVMQSYVQNISVMNSIQKSKDQMLERTGDYFKALKNALALVPAYYRQCDPPEGHERGVTFTEFERFLTTFIVQEEALHEHHGCKENCQAWPTPNIVHTGCDTFECSGSETTCYGQLRLCMNLPSSITTICEYNPLQSRRYEWYESGGELYGEKKSDCPEGELWCPRGQWFGGILCQLCLCLCVEDDARSLSSRSISLREQVSNIEDNMVITGIAFVLINKIMHVKIMQGKLGDEAKILEDSASWMEPEDIQFDPESSGYIKKSADGEEERLEVDVDVAGFDWDRRRINLDTLKLPEKYVLTGVRFRRNKEQESWPVQLEIQGTLFDPETFQLKTDSSTWVTPDDSMKREKYVMEDYDNPTKSTMTSLDSKPYSFIDLHWSSVMKDAGQTTIPLLDSLPVYAEKILPLAGVGLYHKKQPGYAGFLTFVLEGFDRTPYMVKNSGNDEE